MECVVLFIRVNPCESGPSVAKEKSGRSGAQNRYGHR